MQDLLANITANVANRVRRSARRRMASALLTGLALLFAGVGILAGIAALGVVLAARWGGLTACLIIAGAAFGLTLLLVAVVAQRAKSARRRQQAERAHWLQIMATAKAIAPDLTAGKTLLIIAALALMAGLSSRPQKPQAKTQAQD
jgi:hypothetical protein